MAPVEPAWIAAGQRPTCSAVSMTFENNGVIAQHNGVITQNNGWSLTHVFKGQKETPGLYLPLKGAPKSDSSPGTQGLSFTWTRSPRKRLQAKAKPADRPQLSAGDTPPDAAPRPRASAAPPPAPPPASEKRKARRVGASRGAIGGLTGRSETLPLQNNFSAK